MDIRVANHKALRSGLASGRYKPDQYVWVEGRIEKGDGWQGRGLVQENLFGRLKDNDEFVIASGTLAWVRSSAAGEGPVGESVLVSRVPTFASLRTRMTENTLEARQLVWLEGRTAAGDGGQGLGQIIVRTDEIDDDRDVLVGGTLAWHREANTRPNTVTVGTSSLPMVTAYDYAALTAAMTAGHLSVGQIVLVERSSGSQSGAGVFQIFNAGNLVHDGSSIFVVGNLAAVRQTGTP